MEFMFLLSEWWGVGCGFGVLGALEVCRRSVALCWFEFGSCWV